MLSSRLSRAVSTTIAPLLLQLHQLIPVPSFPELHLPPHVQHNSSADHLALHLFDMQKKMKRRLEVPSSVLTWVSCFHVALRQKFDRMLMSSPGTTNSAVAIMEGQTAKIIENSEGMHPNPAWSPSLLTTSRCPNNTLSCSFRARRRAISWCVSKASSSGQPREHTLCHKAINRTQVH